MQDKKKELNDNELDEIFGGLMPKRMSCPKFLRAEGKGYKNECGNCFYHYQNGCSVKQK